MQSGAASSDIVFNHSVLGQGTVHLWCVALETLRASPYLLGEDLLDADERAREAQFVSQRAAEIFGLSHRFLRFLLAFYGDVEPKNIIYAKTSLGKPSLATNTGSEELFFNLSHCGPWVVVGLTLASKIGVDVEHCGSLKAGGVDDLFGLSPAFSPKERDALDELPEAERRRAVIRMWTLKEAMAKATGRGLAQPLNSLQFCAANEHVRQLSYPPGPWSIVAQPIEDDAWLSCAVMGRSSRVQLIRPGQLCDRAHMTDLIETGQSLLIYRNDAEKCDI